MGSSSFVKFSSLEILEDFKSEEPCFVLYFLFYLFNFDLYDSLWRARI